MRILLVLSLLFTFLIGNVFSQTIDSTRSDSLSNSSTDTSKTTNLLKTFKKISEGKNSDRESGMLIVAVIGAATGVGLAAILGSFSLEPSNSKKASLGHLILGGVIGGVIGAIVGGLVSE